MVISQRFKFYFFISLCCCYLIGVWFVTVLLWCLVYRWFIMTLQFVVLLTLYLYETIKTKKADLINKIYQVMNINMLKNWSLVFLLTILSNLYVLCRFIMLLIYILFHLIWFLTICILDLLIFYKFEPTIILFFLSKKLINIPNKKKVTGTI